ncbi:hypothetical protein TcG_06257 [Trypanosoma cruzi]|nr:hypothetical protein TcBrA4_0023980 [Trypanosoma cruzi]PBJ69411.1 hypothetical protein BCY84_19816 [Trypanosoma cruzi cruzi]RNF16540.1 hypothetical protein TcG_06257 [Trypanosoma cruzi]
MCIALGIVAEDDEAWRIASEAVAAEKEPVFSGNNGPFVDVWFGEQKLFGLVQRVAPNDFIQVAQECGEKSDDAAATLRMRVTHNVSFVLHLSSVPHALLQARGAPEDKFVNFMQLVVDYASLLRRGMKDEFLGVDPESDAEYIRFTPQ